MKLILNIALALASLLLGYMLFNSIREPIAFNQELDKRRDAVVAKLIEVREAQQAYRAITGVYAANFDTLKQVLQTGSFKVLKIVGEDEKNLQMETIMVPAADSIKKIKMNLNGVEKIGLSLDSLAFVPYTNGKTFTIKADTITYQNTPGLPVVEVSVPVKDFMQGYEGDHFKRYNANYNPDDATKPKTYYLRFGDMSKPATSGNWE